MSSPIRQRGYLLSLAAEGMGRLVRGCAAGPIGQGTNRAINVFGPAIVERWCDWMREQPPALRHAAISELADLPPLRARGEAGAALELVDASAEDRALAVEYLCVLPRSFQTALVLDPASGGRVLPDGSAPEDPNVLGTLLPIDSPPYAPGSALPGTAYQLGEVVSTVGGVVYRATLAAEVFSIRFPLLRSSIDRLRQYRGQLERFRELSLGAENTHLVRLLDFDLEHPTPFLASEMVSGGDLAGFLRNLRHQAHRGLTPDEMTRLIEQVAEGLAFAHQHGLVHGDVKPANVFLSGDAVKLANLGSGYADWEGMFKGSPEVRALFYRGAFSMDYMAPESSPLNPADPRDDLYSLAILWYQLLGGNVSFSFSAEARQKCVEVAIGLSEPQRTLLARCLEPRASRPPDASAFLTELRPGPPRVSSGEEPATSVVSPEEIHRERQRKRELLHQLKEVRGRLQDWKRRSRGLSRGDVWLSLPIAMAVFLAVYLPTWNLLLANLLGVCAGMLFLLLRFQIRQEMELKPRQRLDQEIELLVLQNPDDVAAWGGPQALRNAELLPEIIAALEEDMRALAIQEEEERSE